MLELLGHQLKLQDLISINHDNYLRKLQTKVEYFLVFCDQIKDRSST